MTGTLSLVTPAGIQPVTVDDVKDWGRIGDDEDALLDGIIRAATAHVEEITGRALLTQTWDFFLDCFPTQIDLPRPRLQTVTSIKYYDTDGVLQTLAATEYTADNKAEPARIVEAYGKSWPSIRDIPNAVEVRYVAGYGASPEDVPEALKQAIKVLAVTMYEHREHLTPEAVDDVPAAFWQLVNQHRMFWL